MRNLVHHFKTDDVVEATILTAAGKDIPETCQYVTKSKVALFAGDNFEPRKALLYSTTDEGKKSAKITLNVGNHILILTRVADNVKLAVFRILNIDKCSRPDATEFTLSVKRIFFTSNTVLDSNLDSNLRAFVSKAIRLNIDTSSDETYWSSPWSFIVHRERKNFVNKLADFMKDVKCDIDTTDLKSVNGVYKFMREQSNLLNVNRTAVYIKYIVSEDKRDLQIHMIPIVTPVKGTIDVMSSGDISKLSMSKCGIALNTEDPMLYQLDKATTLTRESKEELIDLIVKSTTKTEQGYIKNAIRIYIR